jgi:hypothetical protein
VTKAVITYTLPALLNFLRWRDDDEYKKSNWWDKFNYMFINKRPDGRFNRLPWGLGTLATVFRDFPIALWHTMAEMDPLAFQEWASTTVQNSPLSWLPFMQDKEDFLSNVVPSVTEPFVDVAMNRDPFSKAPVDYDENKQNVKLPELRGRERVGVVEDLLAKSPLPYNFSPRQWQFLIRKQLPGLANVLYSGVNEIATEAYRKLSGDKELGALYHPTQTSLLNWKTGSPYGPASLPVNRAIQLYQKAEQTYRSIKDLSPTDPKRMAIEARHPEVKLYWSLKATDNRIRQIKIERGQYIKQKASSMDKDQLDAEVRNRYDKPMSLVANIVVDQYANYVFAKGLEPGE